MEKLLHFFSAQIVKSIHNRVRIYSVFRLELEYLPDELAMEELDSIRIYKIEFEYWAQQFG